MARRRRGAETRQCRERRRGGAPRQLNFAPLLVFALHAALIGPLVGYDETLRFASDSAAIAFWCNTVLTLISYLLAALSDPGFVEPWERGDALEAHELVRYATEGAKESPKGRKVRVGRSSSEGPTPFPSLAAAGSSKDRPYRGAKSSTSASDHYEDEDDDGDLERGTERGRGSRDGSEEEEGLQSEQQHTGVHSQSLSSWLANPPRPHLNDPEGALAQAFRGAKVCSTALAGGATSLAAPALRASRSGGSLETSDREPSQSTSSPPRQPRDDDDRRHNNKPNASHRPRREEARHVEDVKSNPSDDLEAASNMTARVHQRRFCKTCQIYQEYRTKHCRECRRCVRTHDHHCPWLGTCVGEFNHMLFLGFLGFQSIEVFWALIRCGNVIIQRGETADDWFTANVWLLLIGLILVLFLLMVICLFFYHAFLAAANVTTWEHVSWRRITYLKNLRQSEGSPFSRSFYYNCRVFWCPSSCPLMLRRCTKAQQVLPYSSGGKGFRWEIGEQQVPRCVNNWAWTCLDDWT